MDKYEKKVNYVKIDLIVSTTIDQAVEQLLEYKKNGKFACTSFNGVDLYSDTVTIDSAYKEIVGKTKSEFDKAQQEWRDDYKKQEEEHKEKIPELSKDWMEKGRKILTEDKWEFWDKIVPIRLSDLYRGMELGCSLDIIEILNSGEDLNVAKKKIEEQGHSGMSYGLVCSMIKELCDRGEEFVSHIKYGNEF